MGRLGIKRGARKLGLGSCPFPDGSIWEDVESCNIKSLYIPKHGELTTSYWAALTEKAPSPHPGRRRAVLAESRAQGPGPEAALAAPAAAGPAAGGWECGCAP